MSMFSNSLALISCLLLFACPSTKNSSDVDQKNTFPTFSIFYSENSRVTTAYAQVWENQRKTTTLRLTGSAALLFENQDMDLHDGSANHVLFSEMSGTFYRRSIYDLPPQSTYRFKWYKGDDVSTVEAYLKLPVAPVITFPTQNMIVRRQDGIRIKIEEAGYRAQDEKISVSVEDERGNRVGSDDPRELISIGPNEYFLSGDRSWRLRAGEIFVTVTREVKSIERNSNGSILFESKATYETGKLAFNLVSE